MVDILITLWDSMMENGISVLLSVSTVLICIAIYLGVKQYGNQYIERLFHKRNLCWFIAWIVALSGLLLFFNFDIMRRCPVVLVLLMLSLFALFTVAVFKSVATPVFISRWYFKRYEKWLREGKAYEHRRCLEKRPWFILDHDEHIQYELLRAKYLHNLGDIHGAYDAICKAEEMPMYHDERIDADISRVFMLAQTGDLPKAKLVLNSIEDADLPAYCFLRSFISEQEGKLDEAFDLAIEAENAMEPGYKHHRVKTALYNHLGRIYCYRNNQTEMFRYYNMSAKEARKMGDMSQIHMVYHNLIDQSLRCRLSRESVQDLVNEYAQLIKMDHADGVCQIINLKLRLARHYGDRQSEYESILWGFKMLKKVSDSQALAGHQAHMLMMLSNGGFPLASIFPDVEANFDSYFSLPMPMRFSVIWELVRLKGLTPAQYEKTRHWEKKVHDYLENQAVNDLDDYQKKLPSHCVNQRCWVLLSKVDVCAFLNKDSKKQIQWLKELQQIYHDHGLLLNEALNDAHMAKYYAQQLALGEISAENGYAAIREAMEQALEKSYHIPWPYLGNLLIEIACGYDFVQDWNQVKSVLDRFKQMGLTSEHCGYDQQMHLMHLDEDLRKVFSQNM